MSNGTTPVYVVDEKSPTQPTATQVANPIRTYIRSAVQILLAIVIAIPTIIGLLGESGLNLGSVAVVLGQVFVVYSLFVRIMAIPGVEAALQRNLPWLAALKVVQQ